MALSIAEGWDSGLTLREALRRGTEFLRESGVESARVDAELLLAMVLGKGREGLYLDPEAALAPGQLKGFGSALARRAAGEPLAYITGRKEFWSLDFVVTPDVLVPRPETERLVEVALEQLAESRNSNFKVRVLDLGTGSGAIAVSLARELRSVEIWATDVSPRALRVAELNARLHGVKEKIRFVAGDLFAPLPRARFDLIVSNPPYIPRDEIAGLSPEVRDWEPRIAIDGGSDGLALYRRIIPEAHLFLRAGGVLVLEIGAGMGAQVLRLFQGHPYFGAAVLKDYAGMDRVAIARKLAVG